MGKYIKENYYYGNILGQYLLGFTYIAFFLGRREII